MNVLNRAIVIMLMVATILCSTLTILGIAIYQSDVVDLARQVANAYPPGVGLELEVTVAVGVIAAVVSVFAAIILWFEVIPGGAPGVRLNQVSGATAIVTTEAIMQRIKHDAEGLDDVRQARPRVRTNGRDVDVKLDLRLAPGVDVPPLVEEVGRVVREGVESKMGVRLRRMSVYVRNDPYAKKDAGQPRAARETKL